MMNGIGDKFQRETKYQRGRPTGGGLDWSRRPETYKSYPNSPKVSLPDPDLEGGPPIWSVIFRRRSLRKFDPQPIGMDDLSQLLWACQGITIRRSGNDFRTVPSAGGLYPVETYIIANNVDGLDQGVYHYWAPGHQLELLKRGDKRIEVSRAALDQDMAYHAPVVFIWTAVFQRCKWKYRQRAYRYIYLDAGHLVQNLALAAVALGLGSCQIAALYDDEVNEIVGVDGSEESAIYMSVVGRPLS